MYYAKAYSRECKLRLDHVTKKLTDKANLKITGWVINAMIAKILANIKKVNFDQ